MNPTITARTWGGHNTFYLDGTKLPGPSTLAGIVPKDLTNWYATQAAEYAAEHWDQLTGMSLMDKVKQIQSAPRQAVSKAAADGTARHRVMEALTLGQKVETEDQTVVADAEAAVRLMDAFQIEPVFAEIGLANLEQHYAGTADLIASSPTLGGAVLLDHKFGKHLYASHAIQLSAYAHATHRIEETQTTQTGPRGGKKSVTVWSLTEPPEMRLDVAYVMHTRDGVSELHPIKIDGWVWDTVLVCCDLYWEWETRTGWNFRDKDTADTPIGDPLQPPISTSVESADIPDDPPF